MSDDRSPRPWEIWVDMGGTFTDCLGRDPAGSMHRVKVLSSGALRGRVVRALPAGELQVEGSWAGAPLDFLGGFSFALLGGEGPASRTVVAFDPEAGTLRLDRPLDAAPAEGAPFEVCSPEEAVLLAVRLITGTPPRAPLPPMRLRLATTLGTNALLQRRGAPTALLVTEGFGDLLVIGTQQRPDLFALQIRKPAPLYAEVVEVPERLDHRGRVLRPLDTGAVEAAARRLARRGIRAAAVALAHSYRDPAHEHAVARVLARAGLEHVSTSASLSPSITLLTRAETALVDAYLSPLMQGFLGRVRGATAAPLLVMTSAGGLTRARSFCAKDSLLSGPAGGVAGAAEVARRSGVDQVISFDMGGTSTDVARYGGDFDYRFSQRVGDAILASPALAIETVAAGGGSVCRCDDGVLAVGPQSAGASPGPACYGAGGPLTITDVNLLLGRLQADRFRIPVDRRQAERALERVRRRFEEQTGQPMEAGAMLEGFLRLANSCMAGAIRKVSIRRGYDPADHALVAFGGAGAVHACAVARDLGMTTVVVPPEAGLLSALGVGHARVERLAQRQVLRPLARVEADLAAWLDGLAREAAAAVEADGVPRERVAVRRRLVHMRFAGQDSTLQVEWEPGRELGQAFVEQHLALFGHCPEGREVEVESLRVIASSGRHREPAPTAGVAMDGPAPTLRAARARFHGRWQQVPCHDQASLKPGQRLETPSLVLDDCATTVVEPGWSARVDQSGAVIMEWVGEGERARGGQGKGHGRGPGRRQGQGGQGQGQVRGQGQQEHEAVRMELFVGRMEAVAGEMGEVLQRTALSTNIKERRDFSCAVLDARGRLVVNAPHIPVHLGSLGLCVRSLRQAVDMGPGDVVLTNHPAFGGSHLPDVTVVTPVFAGSELVGHVANRAHHAELGGSRPGSMPPRAACLEEEGVVLDPTFLVRGGRPRHEQVRRLLTSGPFPSRAPADNLADLRAAVAANRLGAEALGRLAEELGPAELARFMDALRGRACHHARAALQAVEDGVHTATCALDDGTPLRVRVEVRGSSAVIDFAGTGAVHAGNLNATPAIVNGVVIYLLRLLVDRPFPLNEGLMEAVELRIPPGLLDPTFAADPAACPAVVGGNVETSQRLVDLLLDALSLCAGSQGTMNNVLFGAEGGAGYYETVGGGVGAGPGFHGASAVHSHMTNTRITDVEVLEHRYPVRVERFAVRRGSGGDGRFRGGDGVVRELTFLAPMSLSVLGQHRVHGPRGGAGGAPGAPGAQRVIRADGEARPLASVDGCRVEPGDRLLLKTPGGGGWGKPRR